MMDSILTFAIYAIPMIFAITMHEAAHGWMARRYGDNTAWMLGRVTLNPIPHVDLVGSILVPGALLLSSALTGMGGMLIGWAKPVPVNTRYLNPWRQGMFMVSLAGPASNLIQAFIWLILLKVFVVMGLHSMVLLQIGVAGVMVNFYLMAFNLLPLPPLDGGRILTMLLPYSAAQRFAELENHGMIILVVLLLSGLMSYWMSPFVSIARSMIGWALF